MARAGKSWLPAAYLAVPLAVLSRCSSSSRWSILALISVGHGDQRRRVALVHRPLHVIVHRSALLEVAKTTVIIATSAMVIQLVVGVPLAYVMAFKAGRFEIPCCWGWSSSTS